MCLYPTRDFPITEYLLLKFWRMHDASINFFYDKKIFFIQGFSAKKNHGVMAYVSAWL